MEFWPDGLHINNSLRGGICAALVARWVMEMASAFEWVSQYLSI